METTTAMLLVLSAAYCTLQVRFVQFRRFPGALRAFFSRGSATAEGVTPFQACATSLAATIGTGNIAGVAGAMLLGGPGAVFWMWISALLGMGSKYLEIYFAVRYASARGGAQTGVGPMRYITQGLGARYRPLACVYAVFCLAAALTMGNVVQVQTLAEGFTTLLVPAASAAPSARSIPLGCGVAVAALLAPALFGGATRIGRVAAALVPFMSALYLLCSLALIASRIHALPEALLSIVGGAFCPRAVLGGAAGASFGATFRVGIARGVFTHEAGIGTAALAHGSVLGADAHRQALYGVFEVFLDTLVLCTVTALVVLTSGISLDYGNGNVNGALVIEAFSVLFGRRIAAAFIAVSLALFAFSSVMSFSLYGSHCARFLFGKRAVPVYRLAFLACCAFSFCVPTYAAWRAAEWANALTAIVNTVALFLLSRRSKPV